MKLGLLTRILINCVFKEEKEKHNKVLRNFFTEIEVTSCQTLINYGIQAKAIYLGRDQGQ